MHKNSNDEILVLDENGTNLGRMPYQDAKSLAVNRDLDLVQINKNNHGVVVYKIMDHGKYKYNQKKHKQKKITHPLKEMNFKLRIDPHDLNIKVNRIKEFLSNGSDVKITVTMRGRERLSPQMAREKLDFILEELKDLSQVQQKKTSKSSIFVTIRPLSGKNTDARRNDRERENGQVKRVHTNSSSEAANEKGKGKGKGNGHGHGALGSSGCDSQQEEDKQEDKQKNYQKI